jgi:hypothetical protein
METPSRLALVERICQGAIVLSGGICAYLGRNAPFGIDGLAYIDVARAYLHHDWHTAINGYWGPLYSWLLAIGMWIFRPRMRGELVLVHCLNYVLFVAALLAFGAFWRELAAWSSKTQKTSDEIALPDAAPVAWTLFGYLMFLVTFLWSLDDVTPDILVAGIVFAISALIFRLDRESALSSVGLARYAFLGAVLALGYYAKAILLYFAVFILLGLAVQALRSRNFAKPVVAALVFVALVTPFVAALSRTLGHFSAGDSGKLNYAWFVDGPETGTWMRTERSAPLPFYPGPTVVATPPVFRVPQLEGATYAPWYDAARFDARARPFLSLRGQLRQLAGNLKFVKEQILGAEAALLVSLLILIWNAPAPAWRRMTATWFCALPVLGVVGMYLLTHLVMRFVLGFLLVLWGAAFASIAVSPELRWLARRALLAGTIVFAAVELPGMLHFAVSHPAENAGRDLAIARALPDYGVRPGDGVASIGDGQEAYWAHWAGTPVVAEIWKMDSAAFWSLSPEMREAFLRAMADAGAKAAVWRRDSDLACPAGWVGLEENSGCLILFSGSRGGGRPREPGLGLNP